MSARPLARLLTAVTTRCVRGAFGVLALAGRSTICLFDPSGHPIDTAQLTAADMAGGPTHRPGAVTLTAHERRLWEELVRELAPGPAADL